MDDFGFTPIGVARFEANAFAVAAILDGARKSVLDEIDALRAQRRSSD